VTQGGSNAVAGVEEGQILAGKYRIERILGEGGMGVVVAAHHLQLDERVAIKFLLPDALASSEAVARFAREARAAVKIKSEHVARVIDVGTLDTGAPYLVMEFLKGSDLSVWLAQKGPLPVDQAIEFVLQAAEAVAEAHGLGIIHRDLKPANLFVVRRPDGLDSVKVLDFGISKVTGVNGSGSDMGMTKTTAIMGSPLYMSPEQMAASRNVDARTDIWAFGVILHELLSGHVPFNGETLPEVCVKIATQPPLPLRSYRPDAPAAIEAVILRCLQKDPKERYANVADMAIALAELGPKRAKASAEKIARVIQNAGLGSEDTALPPSSAGRKSIRKDSSTMPGWGMTGPGSPSSRKAFLGVAAALALVATVPIVLLTRRAPSPGASMSGREPAAAAAATHVVSGPAIQEARPDPVSSTIPTVSLAPSAPAELPARAESPRARPAASARSSVVVPAATPVASTKAVHNCDPPFVVDTAGIKHPKPECL
jgi:eukaryotic-like serine/threonine-protein kinase